MSGLFPAVSATGAAISTTGDAHRIAFLETSVKGWRAALPETAPLFVTIDGNLAAVARVVETMYSLEERGFIGPEAGPVTVFRVGQPDEEWEGVTRNGRLGVAANKNTGIELLINTGVRHMFLSDDDTFPLTRRALTAHTRLGLPHSMVNWGRNRLIGVVGHLDAPDHYSSWRWPRGVALYISAGVIERVGGMDERFGPGGYEYAEFSRRVAQAGLIPEPFVAPARYAERTARGPATGAAAYWHCEDMAKSGETFADALKRRMGLTSVQREDGDWERIEQLMAERNGDTTFVPYRAADNGRQSGTLSWT